MNEDKLHVWNSQLIAIPFNVLQKKCFLNVPGRSEVGV